MTTPSPFSRQGPARFIARSLLAAALFLGLAVTGLAAKKAYNLPAEDAAVALRQFAEQAGVEIVYSAEAVRGVRTNAVTGEFTALDAVNRLIAGTDLLAVQDEKTGAIAVNRTPALAEPGPRRGSVRSDDGSIVLDEVEISASKVGGLNNQTILRTDEQGALAYSVISRVDIERMGVTSIEELFRLIPQTSDYGSVSLQGAANNPAFAGGATYQNSEVKLRGFSSLQTTILINGRRLQRGNLSAGPDLNRIPTAAIDRIEILPSSASAIYGGGAIGGAINIILRKDYTGRDVTVGFGTSTDGGAERYQFTYFEGRTLNGGKTQFSYTINYEHSEPLYNGDRGYLQRALRRYPQNTTVTVGGRSAFEQYMLQAYAGMPGTIIINSTTGTLPIPGVTGARYAAIPAGQDGTGLTPASFVATAGQANLGDRYKRSLIYRPEDRYSLNAQLEHEVSPDKLSLYAEAGVSYFRSEYSFPMFLSTLNLTATDPLNPFRTNVTPGFVGVPVSIYYDPVDLPDPSIFQERQGARVLLGAKGKLNDNWEWSLDGTGEYGRSHSTGVNTNQNLTNFLTSTATGTLNQAQRRALYNPLADHNAFPRYDVMAEYLEYNRQYTYYNSLSQVNLRVVGDLFELPAGPVQISPGAEVIWAQYRTRATVGVSEAIRLAIPTGIIGPSDTSAQQARRTESVFFESVVPLVGPAWRPVPIESAELNLGVRWEGTDDSTDATSPAVALRLAPTKDIAFRVSYAEGFFPPDQAQYEGARVNPAGITPFTDPARGNLSYNYTKEEISGGNPDLKPETSKAWNYGIIFTPRAVSGLTLTLDFWKIEKENAILIVNGPSQLLASPESYPGRIQRAAPSASDIANGWLGVVTSVDYRPINVGFTQTEGADIKARYTYDLGAMGKLTSLTSATWVNSFRDQILPINPIVERVNSSGNPLKWRGNSSLFWEYGRWTTGLTATYINSYTANTTTPSSAFPTGNGLDGDRIASATLWDLQLTYQIPAGRGIDRGWQSWFNDTKWTLGVRNVLNKEPAFRTDTYSFYSRYEDPRQRYVTLAVKKSL
ncbi:MAG TPA: TonB-dependent receptor [Opitutaceae bacterium]|nr:TonB-dependent receptor [Opitutaceae bacterium]